MAACRLAQRLDLQHSPRIDRPEVDPLPHGWRETVLCVGLEGDNFAATMATGAQGRPSVEFKQVHQDICRR